MFDDAAVAAPETTEVVTEVSEPSEVTEETPETETESTEEPSGEPSEGTEGDSGESEEDALADLESDGRRVDARTRAAIAQLAKTPEGKQAAKAIREAYFGNKEVLAEFPEAKHIGQAIKEIRTIKATLDSIGGEEGISEMQTEIEDYRNEIKQFAAGDVKLLEQLYDANPESTVTSAQNVLDLLRSKDMKQFDTALLPSFDQRLNDAGLYASIDSLMELVKEGKGQEAFDELLKIRNWAGGVRRAAKMVTEGKSRIDPREEKYKQREENLTKQEQQAFQRGVSNEVTRMHNVAMEKVTRQLFSQLKLQGEGRRNFTQQLANRIHQAMKADKTFQRNFKAMLAKGDKQRAARYNADKFEELLPDHFNLHRNATYPNLPNGRVVTKNASIGTKPGTTGTTPSKTAAPVNAVKRPSHEEVDWAKTSDTQWITGKGITLKNGKRINLNWDAVQA